MDVIKTEPWCLAFVPNLSHMQLINQMPVYRYPLPNLSHREHDLLKSSILVGSVSAARLVPGALSK